MNKFKVNFTQKCICMVKIISNYENQWSSAEKQTPQKPHHKGKEHEQSHDSITPTG